MSKENRSDIITIGGGTGGPIINEALLRTGKVQFIQALVNTTDNGGATGRRRLDSHGKEIAYSDPMRNLLSLFDPTVPNGVHEEVRKLFMHRDPETDAVLGQAIMHAYFDKEKGFASLEKMMEVFGVALMGTVIPTTVEPAQIRFTTKAGRKYTGEEHLDHMSMSHDRVVQLELVPPVEAYPPALNAIQNAKYIFIAPGSLYGSVLSNFAAQGMKEAIQLAVKEHQAKVVVTTNLTSTPNETNGFSPGDYISLIEHNTGVKPDTLVVPGLSRKEFEDCYPEVAELYTLDGSYFLGWDQHELEVAGRKEKVLILTHSAVRIIRVPSINSSIIRHDPVLLSQTFKDILSDIPQPETHQHS